MSTDKKLERVWKHCISQYCQITLNCEQKYVIQTENTIVQSIKTETLTGSFLFLWLNYTIFCFKEFFIRMKIFCPAERFLC